MYRIIALVIALATANTLTGRTQSTATEEPVAKDAERCVLVELFTSQGCNLCPEAEELLGTLSATHRRIVPIAFHVDYFNAPWVDPYSDKRHSERQMAYHNVYPKPKPPEYGLYYTPMLMIDGADSVNGRDRPAAEAAIQAAFLRPPLVSLHASLQCRTTPPSADLQVRVASRSPLAERRRLLIGAVLRDDTPTNTVASGENAGRVWVARFPARRTLLNSLTLDGPTEKALQFKFILDPKWTTNRLRVAVFAQDHLSGLIHQALDLPWRTTSPQPSTPGR